MLEFPVFSARGDRIRVLGVWFGVAVGAGATIGVGILRAPALVAGYLPDFSHYLLVWLAGAIYAFIDANSNAELATLVGRSGGPYVYVRAAFGSFPAFLVGWTDWLINVATIASVTVALYEFSANLAPAFLPRKEICVVGCLCVLGLVQILGLRPGSAFQIAIAAAKLIGLAALSTAVVVAFRHIPPPMASVKLSTEAQPFAYASALQVVLETFAGATSIAYFTSQTRTPGGSLPRSMFLSVLVISVVYLISVIGLYVCLGPDAMATSNVPVSDAAAIAFGANGKWIATVVIAISLLGLLNATVMFAPRILAALSQDGLGVSAAADFDQRGTPAVAVLLTLTCAIVLALSNSFEQLFLMTSLLGLVTTFASNLSLFVLRRRYSAETRPFAAFGYPLVPMLAVAVPAIVVAAAVVGTPVSSLCTLSFVLVAAPLFKWYSRRRAQRAAGSAAPAAEATANQQA